MSATLERLRLGAVNAEGDDGDDGLAQEPRVTAEEAIARTLQAGDRAEDKIDETIASRDGAELRSRREALGMSVRQLAEKTGINRATIANVEAGESRGTSVSAVRAALGELEHELSMDLPADGAALDLMEIQVTGPSSEWRVIVKGPVRDRAELEESAWRLMAKKQQDESG